MAISTTDLKSMSFGYLTGKNLINFSSPELLIKQYLVNTDALSDGVDTAYGEAIEQLSRKYDVKTELQKVGFAPAILIAVLTGDAVSAVTIINGGAAYTEAPTLSFSGGAGTGATATVTITDGKITAITIGAGGSGYTSAPAIALAGGIPVDTRSKVLVKVLSIKSIQNILANLQGLSDPMINNFKWAEKTFLDIRNGQGNLPLNIPQLPDPTNQKSSIESNAKLVCNSFKTIG